MMTLVAECCTLLTVPPFPEPSSRNTIRSSALRSNRNSTPISRVSCLSSLARPPGTCASPAEGAGFGGGALRARPFRFFLFIVFGLNGSPMVAVSAECSCVFVRGGMYNGERADGRWRELYKTRASCPAVQVRESARQRSPRFRVCRPTMGRR